MSGRSFFLYVECSLYVQLWFSCRPQTRGGLTRSDTKVIRSERDSARVSRVDVEIGGYGRGRRGWIAVVTVWCEGVDALSASETLGRIIGPGLDFLCSTDSWGWGMKKSWNGQNCRQRGSVCLQKRKSASTAEPLVHLFVMDRSDCSFVVQLPVLPPENLACFCRGLNSPPTTFTQSLSIG
jgi:hypothetical protein